MRRDPHRCLMVHICGACVLRWQIALRAMSIASEICVYTNSNFVTEVIDGDKKKPE